MRERGPRSFEVLPGERISLIIVAQGQFVTVDNVGVWLDGRMVELKGEPARFSFVVTKAVGESHLIQLECNFSSLAADDARYWISLAGGGGGPDDHDADAVISVAKSANHDVDLKFRVVERVSSGTDLRRKMAPSDRGARKSDDVIEHRLPKSVDGGWFGRLSAGGALGASAGGGRRSRRKAARKSMRRARKKAVKKATRRASKKAVKKSRRLARKSKVGRMPMPGAAPPAPPRREPSRPRGRRRPPRERRVNVGFSAVDKPERPLPPSRPLAPGSSFLFWFQVGPVVAESLEADAAVSLPVDALPKGALLDVVLFAFEGELGLSRGEDVGRLRLADDGTVSVVRQATRSAKLRAARIADRPTLFFPVRTPERRGEHRLRCNVYFRHTLVQSRLVTVHVGGRTPAVRRALRSVVDYSLSRTIEPAHLAALGKHRLSLMLNDNGNGNIGLRFFGEGEFKRDITIDGQELKGLIEQARAGLRRAAWGNPNPWDGKQPYLYATSTDFNRCRDDLIKLARKGYAFYDALVQRFAGDAKSVNELAELMSAPGRLQIALKDSARHVLPISLIYDHRLDNGLAPAAYRLCPAFEAARVSSATLGGTACFRGRCPSKGDVTVVCPSGFWGYRHAVGLPLSIAGTPDAPTRIQWSGTPSLLIAVATDLPQAPAHKQALDGFGPGVRWSLAEDRAATIRFLKEAGPHVAYFYCHGGLEDEEPYLRVGPKDGQRITRAIFRTYSIHWDAPRPLVFINGCHTTALEPEQAIELVSGFVGVAGAAGVIGTEITVFEGLARSFAEPFLKSFILGGQAVGDAVRAARLSMLKAGNPLGLVYVPFVTTSLSMVKG